MPTWSGVAYVCFIVDAFCRIIVGLAGGVAHAHHHGPRRDRDGPLVARQPLAGLRCHSDAGSQFTSVRYGERLAEIGAVPSIGTVGDSLRQRPGRDGQRLLQGRADPRTGTAAGPWKTVEDVELATLAWVHWHNTTGSTATSTTSHPAEFEAAFYAAPRTDQALVGIQ